MAAGAVPDKKKYPSIDEATALNLGFSKEEWDRLVLGMGREPNELEAIIVANAWSEKLSQKSSAMLMQTAYRRGHHVVRLGASRVGVVDIGHGQALALRLDYGSEEGKRDPGVAVQSTASQALSEIIGVGAKPIGMVSLIRLGGAETSHAQNYLARAVEGLHDFSYPLGVPNVAGDIFFHKRFNAAPLLNIGTIGVLKRDHVLTGEAVSVKEPVVYVGPKTEMGGITTRVKRPMAEGGGYDETYHMRYSDPLQVSKVQAELERVIAKGYVKQVIPVNGGLPFAAMELAQRIERGIQLDFDRMPSHVEEPELRDLIQSETCDRFLLVPHAEHYREMADALSAVGASTSQVGEVIDSEDLEIHWKHRPVIVLPFQFILGENVERSFELVKFPPMLKKRSTDDSEALSDESDKPAEEGDEEAESVQVAPEQLEVPIPQYLEDVWIDLLANPNLCSKQLVMEPFDTAQGLRVVQGNLGDSTVFRTWNDGTTDEGGEKRSERAIAVSVDSVQLLGLRDPYLASVQSVARGMRNVAAVGAYPVCVAQCMNYGDPNKHREISEFSEASRGLSDSCRVWDIPIVSDAVSLFNGIEGMPVLGTPVVMTVGVLSDVTRAVSAEFKKNGDKIFLLGSTANELGCSEYFSYCHGRYAGEVPDINFVLEKQASDLACELAHERLLSSCHNLGVGGLGIGLAESCLMPAKALGAEITLSQTIEGDGIRADAYLFSESSGRFLVSFPADNEQRIRELCTEFNIPITGEGTVGGKTIAVRGAIDCEIPLKTSKRIWENGLNHLFGKKVEAA